MTVNTWRSCAALSLSVALAACGGGGGSPGASPFPAPPPVAQPPVLPAPPPPPVALVDPCTGGATYGVVSSGSLNAGKQASAAVVACTGSIGNPQWTQIEGPAVTLLSAKSQLIHFEPTEGGTYGFRVSFTDPSGAAQTQELRLTLSPPITPRAILRNAQAVRMGGKASVRVWAAGGDTINRVTWKQLDGPIVSLQRVDDTAMQFDAPNVTRDTLVRLQATVTTASGQIDADEVLVLVERHDQASASDQAALWGGEHVSRVYAYRPSGPYASALVPCTYDAKQRDDNLCPLSRLPFLAQTTGGSMPSVEQVMDRVVVSHDWMGVNFERFLRTHDTRGDFRRMLMSTTAIVIGAHVRPSFYYVGTGAIYLDADTFWLTPAERDTIDEAPDFREAFSNGLRHHQLWRYVRDNRNASPYFEPDRRVNRTLDEVLPDAASLMYHELTHALDFMPPSQYTSLDNSIGVFANVLPRFEAKQLVSDLVTSRSKLGSTEMAALGQVKFRGATATDVQKAYTADQVAAFFSADLATDEYAYSSTREDLAMSVEELLMSRRLGIQRDVAYIPRNADDYQVNDVRWGQRNRAGDVRMRLRIKDGAGQVVPWLDVAEVDLLPAPIPFRVGASWFSNLTPETASPASAGPGKRALSRADAWRMAKLLERQRVHSEPKRLPGQRTAP